MTHENLLELIDKNFQIGCHSLNHVRLSNNLSLNEMRKISDMDFGGLESNKGKKIQKNLN